VTLHFLLFNVFVLLVNVLGQQVLPVVGFVRAEFAVEQPILIIIWEAYF
jgi:hypothetical protein